MEPSSNLWLISCLDFLVVYFYTSWALKCIYCNVRKVVVNTKLPSNNYIHPTRLLGLIATARLGADRLAMLLSCTGLTETVLVAMIKGPGAKQVSAWSTSITEERARVKVLSWA